MVEYTKTPIYNHIFEYKIWLLNLSKKRCHYKHRNFDLYTTIGNCCNKKWFQYNKFHRLIGPAIVVYSYFEYYRKRYYLRNKSIA